MHTIYQFLTGPMVWIAFSIFIGGSLYRLIRMFYLVYKKESFIFSFMSLKYSVRSILHWFVPFGATNMKKNPIFTIVTFLFHICLLVSPIFLSSHIILLDEAWNISWPALPAGTADIMTMIVISACIFFLIRRLRIRVVKFVTSPSDYLLLAIVAAPFITGFWAYHQLPCYSVGMILHILSGEIMLIAIPFTRLSHMFFFLFSRAYTGSEFGGVRFAKDW